MAGMHAIAEDTAAFATAAHGAASASRQAILRGAHATGPGARPRGHLLGRRWAQGRRA